MAHRAPRPPRQARERRPGLCCLLAAGAVIGLTAAGLFTAVLLAR